MTLSSIYLSAHETFPSNSRETSDSKGNFSLIWLQNTIIELGNYVSSPGAINHSSWDHHEAGIRAMKLRQVAVICGMPHLSHLTGLPPLQHRGLPVSVGPYFISVDNGQKIDLILCGVNRFYSHQETIMSRRLETPIELFSITTGNPFEQEPRSRIPPKQEIPTYKLWCSLSDFLRNTN